MKLIYGLSRDRLAKIYEDVSGGGKPSISFYMMVILSCTISTLGLLTNSAAVIIGAMLIAPLMSPIVASSLAITLGDSKLARSSFQAEISGVILSIVMAILITLLTPNQDITPEILARTKPTILDLLIALASGGAGAYAICFRRGEGAIVPGVAISTALMPPLSVTGIGLATGVGSVAIGGFLLFLANLIAINLASSLVFFLAGFSSQYSLTEEASRAVYRRLLVSASLTILISIPLFLIMSQVVHQNRTNAVVQQVINDKVNELKNVTLVNYNFQEEKNRFYVNTIIRSSQKINHDLVKRLENSLEQRLKKPTKVNMQVVLVQEINPELPKTAEQNVNPLLEQLKPKFTPTPKDEPAVEDITPEETIGKILEDKLNLLIKARLLEFSFSYSSEQAIYEVKVLGEGEKEITVEDARAIQLALEAQLRRKVKLEIEIRPLNSNDAANNTEG